MYEKYNLYPPELITTNKNINHVYQTSFQLDFPFNKIQLYHNKIVEEHLNQFFDKVKLDNPILKKVINKFITDYSFQYLLNVIVFDFSQGNGSLFKGNIKLVLSIDGNKVQTELINEDEIGIELNESILHNYIQTSLAISELWVNLYSEIFPNELLKKHISDMKSQTSRILEKVFHIPDEKAKVMSKFGNIINAIKRENKKVTLAEIAKRWDLTLPTCRRLLIDYGINYKEFK